jgi:hypothetical protein
VLGSKRVFATSTLQNGCNDIAGLAGGDAKCAALAAAAGLSGTFKAWLSDSATSAAARLTHSSAPYSLVDGTQIAANWNDLTDGVLDHAIDEDELGTQVTNAEATVYTGTTSNGASAVDNCGGWLDCRSLGLNGGAILTDHSWTDAEINICYSLARLYCFEQ